MGLSLIWSMTKVFLGGKVFPFFRNNKKLIISILAIIIIALTALYINKRIKQHDIDVANIAVINERKDETINDLKEAVKVNEETKKVEKSIENINNTYSKNSSKILQERADSIVYSSSITNNISDTKLISSESALSIRQFSERFDKTIN